MVMSRAEAHASAASLPREEIGSRTRRKLQYVPAAIAHAQYQLMIGESKSICNAPPCQVIAEVVSPRDIT